MDADIEEKSVDLGGGIAMKVYQVDYCAIQGNGYDTGSVWRTFGVYERREVAEFVKQGIEEGSICPSRR